MQLTISRLVVAIAAFVTGITVAAIWFAYSSPATATLGLPPCATAPDFEMVSVPCSPPDLSALSALPIVEYCDLIRGTVQYQNRIVRVRGIYWSNCENSALDDPSCRNDNRLTWVEGEPYSNFDEGMKPLYQFYGSKAKWGAKAEVVFLGKFSGPNFEGYGHLNACRYRLSVMKVENVKPLPVDTGQRRSAQRGF